MKKSAFIVILLCNCTSPFAGEASGLVSSIYIADDSASILFKLDADIKRTPRCNESGRFSLNLIKRGGMAAYMALLEAKREKYTVLVEGLNTCANHWKSEDILNIQLH